MKTVDVNKKHRLNVYVPSFEHAIRALDFGEVNITLNSPMLGLGCNKEHLSWDEIENIVSIATQKDSNVYLKMNTNLHNIDMDIVSTMLKSAEDIGISGVVFSDTALVYQKASLPSSMPLIMATETTVTNNAMIGFWHEQGVNGFLLSRELNIEQIHDVIVANHQSEIEFELQIHGPIGIFHTLRPVLTNYDKYIQTNQGSKVLEENGVSERALREEKRPKELYRVVEDHRGTYIFSAYDISLFAYLESLLKLNIDRFRIDIHSTQSIETMEMIIRFYQDGISAVMSGEYAFNDDWQSILEGINGYPIKNQFIKIGAPL